MSNVIPIHGRARGELTAGHLFVDRYRLIRRLGRGGMGDVWLAADEKIVGVRLVAVKLLHPAVLRAEGAVPRFLREAEALALLKHHNVVGLYDAGVVPQPFMVMEAVAGVTLREMLLEGGPIPWNAVVCYAIEIADGLSAIHQLKLWHRDLKPENLMVNEDRLVKILDFGIVRHTAEARPAGVTDRIGTLGYVSPEMVLGKTMDHRGDLYALGVVLYELLTGRKPYSGVDESSETGMQAAHAYFPVDPIEVECPEELRAIVLRLLAKDPQQRYQSARELGADLSDVLRKRGSVQPGDALEPMVQRAMVQRSLRRQAALRAAAEQEAARREEQAQREAAEREAAQVRWEHTEPMAERNHTTLKLGSAFVVQSPAAPSAQRPVAATEAVPAAVVPAAATTAKGRSVRHVGVWPAPVLPEVLVPAPVVRAAAPTVLSRPTGDLRSVARVAIPTGVAMLVVTALVLTARFLGVRVEMSAAPVARVAPVLSAAPVVSASAAPLPSPAPPPSTTAPAAAVAPTRSAAPTQWTTVKRPPLAVEPL